MSPAVCFHPQGVVTVGHLSMHPTPPTNITGINKDAEEWMKTINHTGVLMALAHINKRLMDVHSRVSRVQASLAGNAGQLILADA